MQKIISKEYPLSVLQTIAHRAKLEKPEILTLPFPKSSAIIFIENPNEIKKILGNPEDAEELLKAIIRGNFANKEEQSKGRNARVIIDLSFCSNNERQILEMPFSVADECLDNCAKAMGISHVDVRIILGNYIEFPSNSQPDELSSQNFRPYDLDIAHDLLSIWNKEAQLLS